MPITMRATPIDITANEFMFLLRSAGAEAHDGVPALEELME
jgi:hypothetical protein